MVSSGLKAGEQVVVDGHLRLVNGAAVAVKPAHNEAPKPTPAARLGERSACPPSAFAAR